MKGPLQLDLFEPVDLKYQYKVVVTNKMESAKAVVLFHNGRGSQEATFGNVKNDTALSVIPCKRLVANQVFTIPSLFARHTSTENKYNFNNIQQPQAYDLTKRQGVPDMTNTPLPCKGIAVFKPEG